MSARKHTDHPHLTGEHRWGDRGQLILLFMFLVIWITDSFVFHYSTFLRDRVSDIVRLPVAGVVLGAGWYLARGGMRAVFGTVREAPGVINTGVFRIVRHPIYTGAMLFYLGATLITLSVSSAAFWILIVFFYVLIARYEERILSEEFGMDYMNYKKDVGMLFPKLKSSGS